jgi:hypothetical protein
MISVKEKLAIELVIEQTVSKLTEMGCDSVSLFTTMRHKGATDTLCSFDGNYYARIGVVQDWLNHERDVEVVDALCEEEE